jgi:hypothetical protein
LKRYKNRRSVSGYATYLNGVAYTRKSKMQKFVTTSVTKAEGASASDCAKDMLYGMRFLESLNLKVKKPMHLFMDNRGAVDLFYS